MRLIDADALLTRVTEEMREAPNWDYAAGYCDAIKRVQCMIGEASAVDPLAATSAQVPKPAVHKGKRVCRGCGKEPSDIPEYVQMADRGEFASPVMAVIQGEGTYNPRTCRFWCTDCYIKAGCPPNDF